MDDDPSLERVFLFSSDNGHYPYFDIFRLYYAIVDNYSGEVQYISDVVRSTARELMVEDRNADGRSELYRRYFANGEFSVDEKGDNLKVEWMHDTIEWRPEN
jgi:chitinase